MIGLVVASLLSVSQAMVDYTVEPGVARFERGVTFVVTTEKKLHSKKTPYMKPAAKPMGRIVIRPEDLKVLKPPVVD